LRVHAPVGSPGFEATTRAQIARYGATAQGSTPGAEQVREIGSYALGGQAEIAAMLH
jgi:hypothetical protein